MSIGRGKYGGIAEELAQRFKARGIIIAIIEGDKGTGIELVGPSAVHAMVPGFLEAMAKDLQAMADKARSNAQSDAVSLSAGEAASARKDQ